MLEDKKLSVSAWIKSMSTLTVDELLQENSRYLRLKFLLTGAGIWFLLRWLMGLMFALHLIALLERMVSLVLG